MTKNNARPRKRKPSGAPAYTPGRVALATVSVALGLFGTLGWAMADGEWYYRLLMGFLSAASAVVIPLTIPALGRSALSFVLLLPMVFFGGVGAYSFHHAVETLVERLLMVALAELVGPDLPQKDLMGTAEVRLGP